jgi:ATP-dependent RNA helicase DDX52/ROK1
MEAFHLLSRGGVNFDKNKFKSDVKLFSVRFYLHQLSGRAQLQQGPSRQDVKGKEAKRHKDGELPAELDFFKYAAAVAPKRKPSGSGGEDHARKKKQRKEEEVDGENANTEDEEDNDSDINAKQSTDPPMPRHRVTAKGNNIPERADTFEELQGRYHIHSQLMGNLKRYGYEYPTGIQSAGCPILLEVSSPFMSEGFSG